MHELYIMQLVSIAYDAISGLRNKGKCVYFCKKNKQEEWARNYENGHLQGMG